MNVFQMLRLPDLVSLLNLICGIGSIAVAAQSNSFGFALILLLIAAVADGADGYIARRFKGGELGEQLDSLADTVSFGVAPALLIFLEFGENEPLVAIFATFYAVCGVLRLARFNSTMSTPKTGFEGLPITAGCIMLVTYLLLGKSIVRIDFLLALTLALSILMVSSVNYPKIRNIKVLAFVAAVFGITGFLYFIDLQYMRFFSFLPFILMLTYLFSPFLKIPLISAVSSKDYGNKKGLKAGGRKEKQ
ncbi:CDP-diacylglycerol--serine O-phosphatidyltransferase [Methanosarcina sp. 2.H.T.1A.6]|nr:MULTISPECIES: archaetidylserine synthase [unclassified Methanosarcina]KKG10513.1 CDP-diacylglycerol--serine O-phosphatidyltransferase [Methanosarcina sp. 2.H.T.1A.15]KKG13984.1 CDP-diacylglycerol--serine O-phosphatidyltransferase [Methanosarcina sp. 2.H.T.1A.3]KKG20897.1 CDP-diacylglycerol--serine O-phosphatidyltransferase [Methanosarcina sp. 2.H.T.1A.6]KKG25163.1 CDP-diacylglycerol--serine O-phosphatidyltransferase [Methanosarcina sp. 2.H.T.1A.8]